MDRQRAVYEFAATVFQQLLLKVIGGKKNNFRGRREKILLLMNN
jgi:hypothetical protein